MSIFFGEKLREARKKQKFTTQKLATLCGVSRSYISLIENGTRPPGKQILKTLSEALSIETNTLIDWYLDDVRESLKSSKYELKKIPNKSK